MKTIMKRKWFRAGPHHLWNCNPSSRTLEPVKDFSPLEFVAYLPEVLINRPHCIDSCHCMPPTTFPQVFDMRVRSSTTRLHLLEFLYMLTSRLAGSSHLSLLPWRNGLDSHSPRAAYYLGLVLVSRTMLLRGSDGNKWMEKEDWWKSWASLEVQPPLASHIDKEHQCRGDVPTSNVSYHDSRRSPSLNNPHRISRNLNANSIGRVSRDMDG